MIIKIKNLKLQTIIGIHDFEQHTLRDIAINAEIETDFNAGLRTDSINDTINYDEVIEKITKIVSSKKFNLIEKMAQEIMNSIMSDKKIKRCKVEIDKIGVVKNVDSFSILIEEKNG